MIALLLALVNVRFPPIADISSTVNNQPMIYDRDLLNEAQRHSSSNREEVEGSVACGCFYCLETFKPAEIGEWLSEGLGTPLCPRCTIDSVLGDACGYPVTDPAFLRAMHERWFS